MWRLYEQSGLPRSAGLHWNAVPWFIGEPGKEKNVSDADVREGGIWLDQLIDLLPDLRLIITMGKSAERAFKAYSEARHGAHPEWIKCMHPSPRIKATRPQRWGSRRHASAATVSRHRPMPRRAPRRGAVRGDAH